ncbi:MAG: chemotaxis protein CheW, partial [Hydrogenophaga sp.]|nr:chemotaxis protein CheW [Hydrogenophaga sp.]
MSNTAATAEAQPGEYLSFRLGNEEYGIPILTVQEIRGYQEPTRIANAPPAIKGVVNLRGVIVPIVDLRLQLGLEQAVYNEITATIVLNLGQRVVGIVVDSVSDVVALSAAQIKEPPQLTGGIDT